MNHEMDQLAAMFCQLGKAATKFDMGDRYPVADKRLTPVGITQGDTDEKWNQVKSPPVSQVV